MRDTCFFTFVMILGFSATLRFNTVRFRGFIPSDHRVGIPGDAHYGVLFRFRLQSCPKPLRRRMVAPI